MIRIKICGIMEPADAQTVVRAGADAIGLNFFAASPRCVSVEQANEVIRAVPGGVTKVGVFVNSPVADIQQILRRVPVDFVQLHGDEPAETIAELAPVQVIRAWRVRDQQSLDQLFQYLERAQQIGVEPIAVLIDAYQAGQYGGTGEQPPWDLLVRRPAPLEQKPLILAGGLRPENVSHAIHTVRPDGVDVSSGVEQRPGKKDDQRVQRFIQQAVAAFASVTAG